MPQMNQETRDRIKSAGGAALLHVALAYAFLTGLGFEPIREATREMKVFDVLAEPPPPPAVPPPPDKEKPETKKRATKDPEGAAAPPNKKDTPSPVVAPKPEIVLPIPPPVVAAPAVAQGTAPKAGAAEIPGPGTGRGGIGSGLGSGRFGTGTGGGGGGGRPSPVRQIRGRIMDSDWPRSGAEGTVYLRIYVAADGRVSDCRVTRSSGHRDLDQTTCRIIRERFFYRPARNAEGRPIPSVIEGQHDWMMDDPPPDRWIEAEEY